LCFKGQIDVLCFVSVWTRKRELSDDVEKMFNRLYIELQIALLLLAGAGIQGFTEWQSANMMDWRNELVTDIFVALMEYKCGLTKGNAFIAEADVVEHGTHQSY
jgi:hypothetical protein